MSSMADPSAAQETAQQQQKGPEAYLSAQERQAVQRMLRFDEEFPKEFKSFLTEYLSVNFPTIPITQITGFEKYLYKRGQQLPANPRDGQRYTYIADAANGVSWEFRYNEASASQYKWEFAGGPPAIAQADGQVSTTSTAWTDLGGPGITVPLAGDYEALWGASISNSIVGRDTAMGIASATSSMTSELITEGLNQRVSLSKASIINAPTAGSSLLAYYKIYTADCTAYYRERWLILRPVRVK